MKAEIDNAFYKAYLNKITLNFVVSKEINEKEEKIEDKHKQREKLLKHQKFLENKKRRWKVLKIKN